MNPDFHIEKANKSGDIRLQGALDLYHTHEARQELQQLLAHDSGQVVIDVSGLTKLDSVGALLLKELQETNNVVIQHLKPEYDKLFALVSHTKLTPPPVMEPNPWFSSTMESLGEKTVEIYAETVEMIAFVGQTCVTFVKSFRALKHLRFADVMHHIEETGIYAIPVISVMAFMISIVLAYQGIAQLRPLGAENFTVNLVAISVLREMGVLLTAIMVAGRSGSAFAAQIGVMKVREEVDALQVIGIQPFEVLVMPRLIALIIVLPLLTFIADIMGLFGGAIISMSLIHIPPGAYMDRVREVAQGNDFLVGMIKAPVFAFLIAMVGCMHGMKVSGSAESVGKETTAAVVKGIFLVLIADAFFSILFEKMGI